MLGKVFKRDLRHVFNTWWIIAVAVLGIALAGSVAMRLSLEVLLSDEPVSVGIELLSVLGMVFAVFSVIAVFASLTVTLLLVYYHFYKSFYSDEGYLTFTLPVRRNTLLFSKTMSAVIWQLVHFALIAVCALIFFLICPVSTEDGGIFNTVIFEGLGTLLTLIDAGAWLILYIPELLLLIVAATALSTVLVQLCITVGAVITQKYKLLAGIGIYYGLSTVSGFVGQAFMLFGGADLIAGTAEAMSAMSDGLASLTVGVILLCITVAVATLALAVYLVVRHLLEKRLNLA